MTQNDLPLLAIVTRIVAADDVGGTVISLLLVGIGDKIDIIFKLFLVTFTMRSDEFSDGHNVNSVHEITPESVSKNGTPAGS